ncbi:MAG: Holliday junction branch migration protein RuvA [Eubacteriales bacterium]
MYEYIYGKVAEKSLNYVVIDVNGVGYKINTNVFSINGIKEDTAKFFVYLHVREEEQTLYGFLTQEERNMFLRLIAISGIGPKVALAILSTMTVSETATAIITSNVKAFSSVSGVGVKTAQRIILELKERIQKSEEAEGLLLNGNKAQTGAVSEAVSALMSLGYSKAQALRAVNSVAKESLSLEELIVTALKSME